MSPEAGKFMQVVVDKLKVSSLLIELIALMQQACTLRPEV